MGGQRIAEYLVPEPGGRVPKTVFLTDKINTTDLPAILKPFLDRHPDGAALTFDGKVHSHLPLIVSEQLPLPQVLRALISNRQVGAIAVLIPSSNFSSLAAHLGPIDVLIADQPFDIADSHNLPFLADIKVVALSDLSGDN